MKKTPISFAEFKRQTHHKKVKFQFHAKNGTVKTFETDKFYCNKDSRIKMLSMPKFMLDLKNEFYKTDTGFLAISEFGETTFQVIEYAKT